MSQHPALDAELAALNAEWDAITAKRKDWMDAHMADYAIYPIGTELYLRQTGAVFGTVYEHYRYHRSDPQYDRSMSIYYRVWTPSGIGDNTSRLPASNYAVANREELAAHHAREAERLSRGKS